MSSFSSVGAPANKDRKIQSTEQLVLDLCNHNLLENALFELFKRELFWDLTSLLWYSFGTISAFLQVCEISAGEGARATLTLAHEVLPLL